MGDRYILQLYCAYCKHLNKDVYYAESSDFTDFKCEKCKKENTIGMDFIATKKKRKRSKNV